MQFSCESCKAQLQIADEKVRGKRLVVRCKRCGVNMERARYLPEPSKLSMSFKRFSYPPWVSYPRFLMCQPPLALMPRLVLVAVRLSNFSLVPGVWADRV